MTKIKCLDDKCNYNAGLVCSLEEITIRKQAWNTGLFMGHDAICSTKKSIYSKGKRIQK